MPMLQFRHVEIIQANFLVENRQAKYAPSQNFPVSFSEIFHNYLPFVKWGNYEIAMVVMRMNATPPTSVGFVKMTKLSLFVIVKLTHFVFPLLTLHLFHMKLFGGSFSQMTKKGK